MNHRAVSLKFSGSRLGRRIGAYGLIGAALAWSGCAPNTPTDAPDGKALYVTYCVSCHGTNGANDRNGANLTMRLAAANTLPAEDWNRLVQTGRGQMPAFADRLSPTECSALRDYVRRLTTSR